MDFFDDLDATVAEDVEWGDGSDLDSNEEESRPVKQIPADTPVVLHGPAVLRQFPKPGNAASAGDGTVAISAINKDAGEVGGSSGDYTHPDVLIMLAEKAAIAHDRFYDLKWHVASAPKAKVRFLKSADSVVVDAASEVIGYLSGQGKHIKRLSFLVDGSVIKPNCNAATPTPTPTIPVANGGVKCREVDGGGTDAEECAEVLLPQRVAPPSKSRSDTSRLEDSTTAAEGGAAAEGTVTTPPQLTVDTVELPPSALRLSAMCISHSSIIREKQVLELGCGPGVPGMVCAKLGVGKVVLTDYVDGVLRNTQHNVEANACEGRAVVAMLDWLHPEKAAAFGSGVATARRGDADSADGGGGVVADGLLQASSFDTVIAADVIYDEWHAEAVPRMFLRFLKQLPPDDLAQDPDAIRCLVVLGDRSARRGIGTFESNMRKAGFVVQHSDCTTKMSEYAYSWTQQQVDSLSTKRT
eukprot:gene2118-19677_t